MYNKYMTLSLLERNPILLKLFFISSFFIFGLITVLITFYTNYIYQIDNLEKSIKENEKKEISKKIEYLENAFKRYKEDIYSFKSDVIVNEYLKNKTEDSKKNLISLFSHIISTDKNIMQIRYIDKIGDEKVRLERYYLGAKYLITKQQQLQNKSNRYYFKEILKNKENFLWISDIDLNIEFGKIQTPYIPTIRFAMPFYSTDDFDGFIIFNIFMKDILKELTKSDLYNISLIDGDGEILVRNIKKDNQTEDISWSRFTKKSKNIKNILPNSYEKILASDEFSNNKISSKFISNELGLQQKLFLVLEVKQDKVFSLKKDMIEDALNIMGTSKNLV